MYGPTKTARWAIIGFAAVALLVLGGLSWATVASLRLEDANLALQNRESRSADLKLAMWSIDSLITPVLGREISRPYYEYTSYYVPQTLHYPGSSEPAEDVLQESPLLDTSTLEPWIVLHFQYTDYDGWTSPQLPDPDKWPQIEALPPSDPSARQRKELLIRLGQSEGTDRFAEAVEKASHGPSGIAGATLAEEVKIVSLPTPRRSGDFGQRIRQIAQLQELSLPKVLECEPASNILNVIGHDAQHSSGLSSESDGYKVSVSKLTPVWLDLAEDERPAMLLVRRVRVGNILLAYQGFIVDWRALAETLLASASVKDLYEEAKLEPVLASDTGDRTTELGALPLRLVGSGVKTAAAAPSWTSTRTTVAFAWVAAVVALVALGLGVRSMVGLTARRTEFTYAVTHELRTPLTTFQLYTDMLASGLVPEEKKGDYLRTLNEESRRLSDLVAEVLEFSRIENNAVRAHPGAHSVAELLDSIRERYESRCAAAGVRLALDANGAAGQRFHTDLHIALQIVGTLIDNACKYAAAPGAPAASTTPCVRVSAHPAARKLAIEVADNGPGIAPQDRADLFKPFRRGTQARGGKAGGVGLGLALAKRWTRLIHGNLELVDQAPSRGTCFRLTLPAE